MAFWAVISFDFGFVGLSFPFHFGLLALHFLSFWPFGPSFPFVLDFFCFHFLSLWFCKPSFPFILTFWVFISFHFGLLVLHFLSFWPFGPSFPFVLAFFGFHFLSFSTCKLSFPFILSLLGAFIFFHFGLLNLPKGPSRQDLAQNSHFRFEFCNFSFSKICLLGFDFLSFLPFGLSFPFILAL